MSNQLQYSKSPYLLQHQNNPVDWRIWNQETLDLAKKENKLILVSIGYSTCHWCHVMAHECFEEEEIAALMNKYFINIKIDREERPDLDHYFMNAVQHLGISGGWPLNCFLTPDQKVFFGGTYFPPQTKYNKIAWPDLLVAVHKSFVEKNESIVSQSNKLNKVVQEFTQHVVAKEIDDTDFKLSDSLISLDKFIDVEKGGFGFGQKFPNTMGLAFLLEIDHFLKQEKYQRFIHKTTQRMCLGGMYDHIQGGFYRYTVDREWKIPHFEKMAYDHALIICFLSNLYAIHRNNYYLYFIRNSIAFWDAEMRSKIGLYYAALDADSEGEEGLYYLWSLKEIESLSGLDKDLLLKHLELAEMHNGSDGVPNFLNLENKPLEEINLYLQSCNKDFSKMSITRSMRTRPSTDTKHILAWNALIMSSYSKVYLTCFDEEIKVKAMNLIKAILSHFEINNKTNEYSRICLEDGSKSGFAFLEDYAYLAEALFYAYQLSAEDQYLNKLVALLSKIENLFESKYGLFSFNSSLHVDGLSVMFDSQDSSLPNANAVLAQIYLNLYQIYSDQKYFNKYEAMYRQVIGHLENNYFSHMSWLKLSPELLSNTIVLKANNSKAAFQMTFALNLKSIVYFYTNDLAEEEVQFCFKGICYPGVSNLESARALTESFI